MFSLRFRCLRISPTPTMSGVSAPHSPAGHIDSSLFPALYGHLPACMQSDLLRKQTYPQRQPLLLFKHLHREVFLIHPSYERDITFETVLTSLAGSEKALEAVRMVANCPTLNFTTHSWSCRLSFRQRGPTVFQARCVHDDLGLGLGVEWSPAPGPLEMASVQKSLQGTGGLVESSHGWAWRLRCVFIPTEPDDPRSAVLSNPLRQSWYDEWKGYRTIEDAKVAFKKARKETLLLDTLNNLVGMYNFKTHRRLLLHFGLIYWFVSNQSVD